MSWNSYSHVYSWRGSRNGTLIKIIIITWMIVEDACVWFFGGSWMISFSTSLAGKYEIPKHQNLTSLGCTSINVHNEDSAVLLYLRLLFFIIRIEASFVPKPLICTILVKLWAFPSLINGVIHFNKLIRSYIYIIW